MEYLTNASNQTPDNPMDVCQCGHEWGFHEAVVTPEMLSSQDSDYLKGGNSDNQCGGYYNDVRCYDTLFIRTLIIQCSLTLGPVY